jgi:hypothetical protein
MEDLELMVLIDGDYMYSNLQVYFSDPIFGIHVVTNYSH